MSNPKLVTEADIGALAELICQESDKRSPLVLLSKPDGTSHIVLGLRKAKAWRLPIPFAPESFSAARSALIAALRHGGRKVYGAANLPSVLKLAVLEAWADEERAGTTTKEKSD